MRLRPHPTQLLILGFAAAILLGGIVLALPVSAAAEPISFLDALFTSTSAVCVTGLVVVDTGSAYSAFGQAVILLLIQAGGLGIMTLSTAFVLLLGRKLSLRSIDAVHESFTYTFSGGLRSLLRRVLIWTLAIEAIGAALLFAAEVRRLPAAQALWFAVFHAISAFCNAGFALRSDSFVGDRGHLVIVPTLAVLIVLGGLGFTVITELGARARCWLGRRPAEPLSLHARLALSVSAALIIFGVVGFLALEANNVLRGTAAHEATLMSLFASITPRTAGFNTVDYGQLTIATLYMTVLLMMIGGSPGSTAGGIKTTTFGVVLALARARYRGEPGVRLFNRGVPDEAVGKAIALVTLAFSLVTAFIVLLTLTELGGLAYPQTHGKFMELFFEAVSAFGTVGLSMGATPKLSELGKILIMVLMFIGRLGPLTISIAIAQREARAEIRYAEEPIMIG